MKKLLLSLATGLVLDTLIVYAQKQRSEGGLTQAHYDRWTTIISFLQDMKLKGIPV